jgi:hypothetical protein
MESREQIKIDRFLSLTTAPSADTNSSCFEAELVFPKKMNASQSLEYPSIIVGSH